MTTPLTSGSAAAKLRDIQSITDAALSNLDEQAFLAELLDRVRAVFQADTAAVLLLDRSSSQLIATAASGLEEEVNQGMRLPVGRGFAGLIAATREPVILQDVDHDHVLNPLLLEKGIRTLMGVPMVTGGKVIGVLHVGSREDRQFTSEDTELLQLAADRAAAAVQSVLARSDRAAAAALQRSLVPPALPAVPGAELAARYVPGNGNVGGDWYDVFALPSGEMGVVMGDVAGSGLPAAVIMGRMRSALRAYALETGDPAEALGRLDRKMQHFEPSALATVLYAIFAPDFAQMRVSCAGHLPPVVAVPGQPAAFADVGTDLLIGMDTAAPRTSTTVAVPPGTVVAFYTDGLVERRGQPLDEGLGQLCAAVTPRDPDDVCVRIMLALVGAGRPSDDVALLVLRRPPAATAAPAAGTAGGRPPAGTG
ncbi:MAG: SpoIIE family protein phosphatase [Actinobacteria bacterium]|nr:SpoIIE family protein phosphatase [Actinomycetota bacterium]